MNTYRFQLEPYKGMATRYICPKCKDRSRTFVRYIDKETGRHINPDVGRCNREDKCGYHYTPREYFQDNKGSSSEYRSSTVMPSRQKTPDFKPVPLSYISSDEFRSSLMLNHNNNFLDYLKRLFGNEITARLAGAKATVDTQMYRPYFIGTSNHWAGATIFWQIDVKGKVRTGKIMLYHPLTGKRVKHPFNHINWVHKVPDRPDFNLKQCMFGEHLLADKTRPVAIVESEKTAIIASIYLPEFIWLACGSLTNLNADKCSVLQGRQVMLFPDLNGYEKWSAKAKELSHIANFTVSDLLERKATENERKDGLDLADYLIRFDFRKFSLSAPQETVVSEPYEEYNSVGGFDHDVEDLPGRRSFMWKEPDNSWADEIGQLEKFYSKIVLPTEPVKLDQCSTIIDVPLFLESHFAIVRANQGKPTFRPYLERLQKLRDVLGE